MVQTDHRPQRVARDRSITARRCCVPGFDSHERADRYVITVVVLAVRKRQPFLKEIMRLQHQANANVPGRIGDTHDGAAGDGVDLRTGDSFAAQIEVRSNSDSPISPCQVVVPYVVVFVVVVCWVVVTGGPPAGVAGFVTVVLLVQVPFGPTIVGLQAGAGACATAASTSKPAYKTVQTATSLRT